MKTLLKIVFIILISFGFLTDFTYAWDLNSPDEINFTTWADKWVNTILESNTHLQILKLTM